MGVSETSPDPFTWPSLSVNKEVMVENLKEHSLISQRVIHDHVRSVGGLLNIAYTKVLLSAAAARLKYHMYLDDQRRLKQDEQKAQKRNNRNKIQKEETRGGYEGPPEVH